MGPNCVRLVEELTQKIRLSSEMRILDLGCGTGLTSIFLQRFGAKVFAADLWIHPTENYERFCALVLKIRLSRFMPKHTICHSRITILTQLSA